MNSSFVKAVGVLVGGTAGAQFIMLLSAPLLTRLYVPENFGLFAMYTSLLAIISIMACLRYEIAIPLPKYRNIAINLVGVACLITAATSLLLIILVYLFEDWLVYVFGEQKLQPFFWTLPFAVFLTGFQQVLSNLSVREKHFKSLSVSRLSLGVVTVSLQLILFKLEELGLLLGQIIGLLVSTLFLANAVLRKQMLKVLSRARMVFVVRRFIRFPKFSVWDGFSNTAGTQLPTIFIASSFGAAAGGLYSMTMRVLVFPVTLIGAAVGQVFLSDAPLAHRENRLASLVHRLTEIMLGLSLPFIVIAFLFGPDLFALVFGDAWRQSGEFAKWLSPWIILTFVYSPLSSVFSVLKLEQVVMKLQLTLLVLRLIVLGVGVFWGDLLVTVILFGVLNFIYYSFLICKVLSLINISVYQFLFVKAIQLITLSGISFLFWASGTLESLYLKNLFLIGAAVCILFYVKQTLEIVEVENA